MVVVGWKPGRGRRTDTIGALVLAVPDGDGRLRYAGGVHRVTPDLVGEVELTEWTTDRRLRHPSWRGLRPDKTPGDVALEP